MEINKKTLKSVFWGAALLIILHWVLNETERVKAMLDSISAVVSPFLVGAGLAFILNVPMRAIEKRLGKLKKAKLQRTIALVITLLAVVAVLTAVVWLLVTQVISTAHDLSVKLPEFFDELSLAVRDFIDNTPQLKEWTDKYIGSDSTGLGAVIQEVMNYLGDNITPILSGTVTAVSGVGTGIFNAFISLVFAIYCLFCKESLARQGRKLLFAFLPEKVSDEIIRVLRMANSVFSNFLSGQCIEVCILGTMFAIAMSIFGMPFAPLISVLIAVTAFIPVVGAFIGCVFGAFFILVDQGLIMAVWFVVMFLILQQIENNLIYPRIVGNSIGLPGMWVLLAVAVGGKFMGAAGMFLMIPVASVLYSLLREFTSVRLDKLNVDKKKLEPQPPELNSNLKTKHENFKRKVKEKRENKKKQGSKQNTEQNDTNE